MFIISQGNSQIIDTLKIITKIVTIFIAMFMLILVITAVMYKPAYKVTLSEKEVGIIDNKAEFISDLDGFLKTENNEEIAYIEMHNQPTYNFMLVKREMNIDDSAVYKKVIDTADIYYRVFTINAEDAEIATVKTVEEAEALLSKIKEIKTKIEFTINETHTVNPVYTEETAVLALVEQNYKIKTKTVATVAKRVASDTTYVAVNVAFATPSRGTITSRYGYRSGGEFHTGIDIANPVGTPIYAAADGKVIFSGVRGNYGRLVIIEHEENMITYYAHCNELLVEEGDTVVLGQQIATIGLTGRTTGAHVHFEVRIDNESVNPEKYVKNIGK